MIQTTFSSEKVLSQPIEKWEVPRVLSKFSRGSEGGEGNLKNRKTFIALSEEG